LQSRIIKNLRKDFLIEFRNRSAVNISFAFAGITTLSVSLACGGASLAPQIHSVLLWIIIFFSGMSGLSHIFIREEEERTSLFLALHSDPENIYLSKLVFNIILFTCITAIVTPLYLFFMQVVPVYKFYFIFIAASGSLAIASITTILGAMVAKAESRGSLFTVISFPVMIPVLWISIQLTSDSLEGGAPPEMRSLLFLLAFSGVIISVSYLAFKFIWTEQ
jgi:heme exporter protein B